MTTSMIPKQRTQRARGAAEVRRSRELDVSTAATVRPLRDVNDLVARVYPDLPVTVVRPRGPWVTGTKASSRMHRVSGVRAVWGRSRVHFAADGPCGFLTANAILHLDPPNAEVCDECLFIGEHVVYRFFDIDALLIYVGSTSNLIRRLAAHRHTAPWWPLVKSGSYEVFPTKAEALAAEVHAIDDGVPLANIRLGDYTTTTAAINKEAALALYLERTAGAA